MSMCSHFYGVMSCTIQIEWKLEAGWPLHHFWFGSDSIREVRYCAIAPRAEDCSRHVAHFGWRLRNRGHQLVKFGCVSQSLMNHCSWEHRWEKDSTECQGMGLLVCSLLPSCLHLSCPTSGLVPPALSFPVLSCHPFTLYCCLCSLAGMLIPLPFILLPF